MKTFVFFLKMQDFISIRNLYPLCAGLFITASIMLFTLSAHAQCPNDNQMFGINSMITCGSGLQTLATCIYGGEYRLVNVIAGNTYEFSTCGDTDFDTQITIYDNNGGPALAYNDNFCGLQSKVTWLATFTGFVRINIDQVPCSSNTECMTLQLACVPPLPLCLTTPATPENGASTCPQGPGALNWPNAQHATNYDVYFGTTPNPPFVTNTNLTSYSVSNLALGTYYWKIIPKNSAGSATECVVWSFTVSGNILYVKANATGANNGTSWADAYTDLQSALNSTCPGVTEIWVAAGTYKPTSGTDRSISFSMKNGVGIYGGFNGTETQLSQRNWRTNVTTLSGDIGTVGVNTDNSRRVISNNGLNSTAVLDGFTIRDGYNPILSGNSGYAGGIWNDNSSPTFSNCIIRNNYSRDAGGGVAAFNSSPTYINCLFTENASGYAGGAIYTQVGTTTLTNCTIVNNSAIYGGAIGGNISSTNHIVKNCIIWGNTAPSFNPIDNNQNSSSTISNSIVQGGWSGTGNLNADPLFVNAGGDFRLQACSSAIDAGSDADNSTTEDLNGNPRKRDIYFGGSQIDIGAYEALAGDNTPPSITCPANIPCVEATSPSGAVVFYASPTAVDNCDGNVPVNAVLTSGSNFALGLNTVVASAFDSRGNSAFCSFTIEVCDRTPPTIHNLPSNISCVAATSPTGAVVTYISPTATDIVDIAVPVTCFPASGSVFPIGSTTVICTATDAAGNMASSSFTVSVDGTPPSVTCPTTQSLDLGANCSAMLPDYTSLATTGDNCGVQSVTQSPVAGTSVSGAGNMSVTLTVTDVNGLTNSCTFTVTKVDNTPPTITCPMDVVKDNDPDQCGAVVTFDNPSISDNCTFVLGPVTETFAFTGNVQNWVVPPGVTSITVDVYGGDGHGALGLGGRVQATHPVTPGETLYLYVGGAGTETAGGFNGGGSGGSEPNYGGGGGASDIRRGGTTLNNRIIVAGGGGGTGSNCGTNTAEGGHGGGLIGGSGCDFSCVSCQYTGAGGTQTAGGVAGPTSFILCTGNQNGFLGAGGSNVADFGTGGGGGYYGGGSGCFEGAGGGSSYTSNLATNVIHTQGVRFGNGLISITYGNQTLILSEGQVSGSVFPVGITTNTFTISDDAGNTANCSFNVTINDVASPSITCPNTQTLALGANCTAALPDYTSLASTSDNCGVQGVTQSPAAGTPVSGAGNMNVTLTVTDVNGLTNTCTFTVTKVDNTAPSITCPATQTLALGANCSATLPNYTSLASPSDNCGVQGVTQSPAAGTSVSGAGNMNVTLTVTDVNGLTNTCTFTVTKVDNTPPTITCPSNIPCIEATSPAGAVVFYTTPTAVDNCDGNVPVNAVLPSGSTFAVGLNTVVASAFDSKGNSASCSFTIQVCDRTPPTLHDMPNNISCVAATSPVGAVVTYTSPTATDIVDGVVPVTCVPASGSVFPLGSTTVVCTATDVFGNTASSSFVVSVDGTPPSITCPATQTLALGANCSATLPSYTSLATTGDDCGVQSVTQSPAAGTTVAGAGNMSVTLTVTDISGLTNSCTFTVIKVDNTAPSITCPATQTLVLGANCSATLPNYTSLATTSDNCGVQGVTQSPSAGTPVSGAGNMSVTLTVTDVNGLTNTCTFTVTKVDNTPPTISCLNTTATFNGDSSLSLSAASLATASDNCGSPTLSLSSPALSCAQAGQTVAVTVTATDAAGLTASCTSQVTLLGLPCGWSQQPNGIGCADGSSVSHNSGVFTVNSADCYSAPPFTADEAGFAQHDLCGNGSITALVSGINGSGWAGISMRESNAPGARKVQLLTNLGSLSRREVRYTTGGQAYPQQFPSQNRYWLRILRQGSQFVGYVSANGASWSQVFAVAVSMANCIEVGLIVTNNNPTGSTSATFSNVSVIGNAALAAIETPDPGTEIANLNLKIFPNPTSGEVTVDFTLWAGQPALLEVYDLQGRRVHRLELDEATGPIPVDMSQLPSGVYLFRVGEVQQRVVLQR